MKQGVDVSSSIRYEQCIIEVLRASKEVFIFTEPEVNYCFSIT